MEDTYLCRSCKKELPYKEAAKEDLDCPQCGEKMVPKDHDPDDDSNGTRLLVSKP